MKTKLLLLLSLLIAGCAPGTAMLEAPVSVSYDETVLADAPVGYWAMTSPDVGFEPSLAGDWPAAAYHGAAIRTALPNGDVATVFEGQDEHSGYLEIADDDRLSVTTTGELTVEAWFRPDTLVFPTAEGVGGPDYVHWLGKGNSGKAEWTTRIYSEGNSEGRHNRISGYAFKPAGGTGVGSYFQDPDRPVVPGVWLHVALVIDIHPAPGEPLGSTTLFVNGAQIDHDSLHNTFYNPPLDIVPANGNAPMRIGTRDAGLKSYLLGAIGKVAVYDQALTADQLAVHFAAMAGGP
jgi:concanavalin A-like lectin/glucanase superfamily protein